MFKIYLIVLLISDYKYINNVQGHKCKFQPINNSEFYTDSEAMFYSNVKSSYYITPQPIRIHYYFTKSFSDSKNAQFIIKNYLEVIKKEFQALLNIKRVTNEKVLLVQRACTGRLYTYVNGIRLCLKGCALSTFCNGVKIPEKYLRQCYNYYNKTYWTTVGKDGKGERFTDLVMIVDVTYPFRNLEARTCFHDKYDRPILGSIVIPVDSIKTFVNPLRILPLFKHQMVHALGFDISKYAFFRDVNGDPIIERDSHGRPLTYNRIYLWNDKITKKFTRKRVTSKMNFLTVFVSFVMKNTLYAARDHFKCNSIDGVDFEDFDNDHIIKAGHFDELIYGTELMTSVTDYDLDALSRLTLAFLEDTGWYIPNYERAEIYNYAKDSGCDLPFQGCYSYLRKHKNRLTIDPFCDFIFLKGPTFKCRGKDYFYYCQLIENSRPIDKHYIYFDKLKGVAEQNVSMYSGTRPEAEFCPLPRLYFEVGYQSSSCFDSFNQNLSLSTELFLPSYYGETSVCLEHTIIDSQVQLLYGAACHNVSLINSTHFIVYLTESRYICTYGSTIQIAYNGFQIAVNCGTVKLGRKRIRNLSAPVSNYFVKMIFLSIILTINYTLY